MNNENIYTITEETYEATVNERILLYSFVRQLAFQMKRAETLEDFFHLKEAAAIYGGQAEKLFETWDIPGRYVVYGDPGDLDGIKELELLDYGEDGPDEDTEDAVAATPKPTPKATAKPTARPTAKPAPTQAASGQELRE